MPLAVHNLSSAYVARRDLWAVFGNHARDHWNLTIEQTELILELAGGRDRGRDRSNMGSHNALTLKALEAGLASSQPHMGRRVEQLDNLGLIEWVDLPGAGVRGRARQVRLSAEGRELASSVDAGYRRLSEEILNQVGDTLRLAHFKVSRDICRRIQPRQYLGVPSPTTAPHPVENVLVTFEVTRGLRKPIADRTLPGSGVSLGEADVLTVLLNFCPPPESGDSWDGEAGYVSVGDLAYLMVHSVSPSKFLVSRLLASLNEKSLIQFRDSAGNRKQVRLTDRGMECVRPIWARYRAFAEELMDGIAPGLSEQHIELNRAISRMLQPLAARSVGI